MHRKTAECIKILLLIIGIVLLPACSSQDVQQTQTEETQDQPTDTPDTDNQPDRNLSKIIVATDGSGDYQCDGIADEEQINQALREVSAAKGTVHLKAGVYTISSQIIIEHNGTVLEGEGRDKTFIKLKAEADWGEYNATYDLYSNAPPLIINSAAARRDLTFKDFTLDGNKYNQHYQVNGETRQVDDGQDNYHGFKLLGRSLTEMESNITFSRMRIMNTADDGIFVEYAKNVRVEDTVFDNVGHSGTYMVHTDGAWVKNSRFLVTANSGVRFDSSDHIAVEGNRIYGEINKTGNSNFGIQITVREAEDMPFTEAVLEKNIISHTAGAGICVDAENPSNTNNLQIRNNVIYQCGNVGTNENRRETGAINLKNLNGTVIANNTLVNNIGGAIRIGGDVGFADVPVVTNETRKTLIVNNIITDTIKGNSTQSQAYGIDIQNTEANKITCRYNNFWNNESSDTRGCEKETDTFAHDPKFVSMIPGQDFWSTNHADFDLHLQKGSPSIDKGDPNTPVGDEPLPNGGIINLGAYGGTNEATTSD